jgi:hydroxymethylpyrimidine/phosphomethylpyrimidine kinase
MLTSSATISSLAHYLALLPDRPLTVLDPVMISTSGHTLLPDDAISAITSQLLPHVDWVTPNIPEAQRLVNSTATIISLSDLLQLAEEVREGIPARTILLKGGHLGVRRDEVRSLQGQYEMIWEEGDEEEETVEILELYRNYTGVKRAEELVVDVLVERGKGLKLFVGKKLDSTSTHGTGCTLSSAIASAIATRAGSAGEFEPGGQKSMYGGIAAKAVY